MGSRPPPSTLVGSQAPARQDTLASAADWPAPSTPALPDLDALLRFLHAGEMRGPDHVLGLMDVCGQFGVDAAGPVLVLLFCFALFFFVLVPALSYMYKYVCMHIFRFPFFQTLLFYFVLVCSSLLSL